MNTRKATFKNTSRNVGVRINKCKNNQHKLESTDGVITHAKDVDKKEQRQTDRDIETYALEVRESSDGGESLR